LAQDLKIGDILFWRSRLGMLPVPLFQGMESQAKFVLLNGARGNFCLDLSEGQKPSEMRSRAWSSDVGHYVILSNGFADVLSWDSTVSARQRFRASAIEEEPERFHNFLLQSQPNREFSIVTRLMRTFRSLRAALEPNIDGPTSLTPFLYLLACAEEGVDRGKLNPQPWNLPADASDLSSTISKSDWDAIYRDATDIDGRLGISARFDLVLSHASGQLFQEAHYQSVFLGASQMSLSGFAPRPVSLQTEATGVGIHFTPPSIARALVEESMRAFLGGTSRPATITVFDPACGSGEFLREALRQLKLSNYEGKINLIGWDISRAACDIARFSLAWEARTLPGIVEVDIQNTDSMRREDWPKGPDILLMNPPFQSWEDMNSADRDVVANILGVLVSKKPDLAFAFLFRAAQSLGKLGVLGAIIPASIFDSSSARALRSELSTMLTPRLLARLGNQALFSNATVDVGVYLGVAGGNPSESPLAFWADHRSESTSSALRALRRFRDSESDDSRPIETDHYSIYPNGELGKNVESWAPRPYRSWTMLKRTTSLPRVRDFFAVKQGIRTGANDVFLISSDYWRTLPARERRFFRPAVVNESIRKNVLSMSVYVFFPYGRNAIGGEVDLAKQVGTYYSSFLEKNRERLKDRAGINPNKWWELTRHRVWQVEEEPKLVSTYFGDSGSFAIDKAGSSVVVQGFAWIPKTRNAADSAILEGISYAYLAILSSPQFSTLLAATSNHVGGGQWNLSKKFVDLIPLPNLLSPAISADIFRALVETGWKLAEGSSVENSDLKSLVDFVYGLETTNG